jgi:hypothetical protein
MRDADRHALVLVVLLGDAAHQMRCYSDQSSGMAIKKTQPKAAACWRWTRLSTCRRCWAALC